MKRAAVTGVALPFALAMALAGCFVPSMPDPSEGAADSGTFETGAGTGDAGPGGPGSYEYPGCASSDSGACRGLPTFYCAAEQIRLAHAACSGPQDCEMVPVQWVCSAWGQCGPPAVNGSLAAAFLAAYGAELGRYCLNATCFESGMCAFDAGMYAVVCTQGRCALSIPDVGSGAPCADNDAGTCFGRCAAGARCVTQVSCEPSPDGGSTCRGNTAAGGDGRCHRSCQSDGGGCGGGEVCTRFEFFGCSETSSPDYVCCPENGGC